MKIPEEVLEKVEKQLLSISAKPFFLCISGSDNYGFASEGNSDVDIRGVYYYTDPDDIFDPPAERGRTKEGEIVFDGMLYEWQLHEVSKFLHLLGKSNMNIMDWLYSIMIIQKPPPLFGLEIKDLQELALESLDQRFVKHTLGWTMNMYNKDWKDPKKPLHAIRPLMTCLHFMETSQYITNIQKLIGMDPFMQHKALIRELIELKMNGLATNNPIRDRSIKTYHQLEELVKAKRQQIRETNEMADDLRKLLTRIRIATLKQHDWPDQ